jgi:hypothetical protein
MLVSGMKKMLPIEFKYMGLEIIKILPAEVMTSTWGYILRSFYMAAMIVVDKMSYYVKDLRA